MNCRITGKPLTELFSLGELYISDFILDENDYRGKGKYDLTMMLSPETRSLQLKTSVNKDLMYGKYWYRSGTNASMKQELKDIAEDAMKLHKKKSTGEKKIFLDIASNDGTLLGNLPAEKYTRIGIDPVKGYDEALERADIIIEDYFSKEIWDSKVNIGEKADIITCIAMFYDLDDPTSFLKEIHDVMDDDGLFIIQQSYMPLMIQQLAFDNICHEHVFYHSLHSMEYMLNETGFRIVDVKLNDVNGGSFRLYIQKKEAKIESFYTAPFRDVANMRVDSLRAFEDSLKLDDLKTYDKFYKSILELKTKTYDFVVNAKKEGKKIWVYGASTKGNTLLQWFGLDNTLIEAAAERSPYKFGLKTIGTNIPIFAEEMMRQKQPDYLLVLPWHFISEFKEREIKYLSKGGNFIIPCPEFNIIK
jgi:SAM-dependent methyltransferase